MRIIDFEVNGYKRLANVGDIRHFRLKPTERVQMLLGRNGSGKSSLMAELTPLPAVAANYTKDGSKTIEIVHRGQTYLLKNDFSAGHVHSFIRESDNEELNPGGTLTVQRELVQQVFGIRQEIHDLVTGVEKFSAMSPSRRREWFTELCDTSYDYALKVFGKTKDTVRDINGALKLAKKRLVAETAMIVKDEDLSKINADINQLVAEIDLLYRSRIEKSDSMANLESYQQQLERESLVLTSRLFALNVIRFMHPDTIQENMESTKMEIVEINTKIALLVKEHALLKETHDACIKTGAQGLESLKEQLETLRKQRDATLKERRLELEFADPKSTLSALENMWPNLQLTFSEIPINSDRMFSQANLAACDALKLQLSDKLSKIDENIEKLRHQKLHLDQIQKGEQTECPKCNHKWFPGYSPSVYSKILELIEELVKKREETVTALTKNEANRNANWDYKELMREYQTMARMSTQYLQPFWDLINVEELIYKAPRSIEVKMEQLKHDLGKDIYARQIDIEIEKTKDLIQVASKAADVDIAKVATRLDIVEEALGMLSSGLKQTNSRQQASHQALNKVNELLALEAKITNYQSKLEQGVTNIVLALRNELITDALRKSQIELAQKQKTLNDIQKQQAVVDDIAAQVKSLQRDEDVHKLILNELSPTDGLIAEGLLGFIKTFIRKMNIIIRKIWSYKLEVQDCSTGDSDDTELDYKFAMIVNTERIPDIKLGSTGIREVVDLAFKIVATHYLDLSEAPLFLDEFGSSFDAEHRIAATSAIKSILEQMPFSQLFMISHYEDHYGAFTNAQFAVLAKGNIVIPAKYNQHVEIA